MPELPEVETIVQELQISDIVGRKIINAAVFWPRTVDPIDPVQFCEKVKGKKIRHISRKGKWIEIELTHAKLFIHLRMTGKLLFSGLSDHSLKHERLRLELDDGRVLHYEDQRKFGRWKLVLDGENSGVLLGLGVEPLSKEFTWEYFKRLLESSQRKMKPFLLDQKNIAGLGNIYVDEVLWEAKVHPLKTCDRLTSVERRALFLAIPKVLKRGIENRGTSLGNYQSNYSNMSGKRGKNQHKLNVFRREGLPCHRCGREIIKCVVCQRGTHFCPSCQKV